MTERNVTLEPAYGNAADVVIYVAGQNGIQGTIGETPAAVDFGEKNTLVFNLYAPNGTILINQNGALTGAVIGRWVVVGKNASLSLASGFNGQAVLKVLFKTLTFQKTRVVMSSLYSQKSGVPVAGVLAAPRPYQQVSYKTLGSRVLAKVYNAAVLSSTTTVTTITYTYDALGRLTNADYSNGDSFAYGYDSVGNRLTKETVIDGQSVMNNY